MSLETRGMSPYSKLALLSLKYPILALKWLGNTLDQTSVRPSSGYVFLLSLVLEYPMSSSRNELNWQNQSV